MALDKKIDEFFKVINAVPTVIVSIITIFSTAMCFLLTYMLLYGYYFENEKVTLETILSPVPFDPRTLLFIGTTIFFVIGILLLVSIQLGDSIKSKEKTRIFVSIIVSCLIVVIIGSLIMYFTTNSFTSVKMREAQAFIVFTIIIIGNVYADLVKGLTTIVIASVNGFLCFILIVMILGSHGYEIKFSELTSVILLVMLVFVLLDNFNILQKPGLIFVFYIFQGLGLSVLPVFNFKINLEQSKWIITLILLLSGLMVYSVLKLYEKYGNDVIAKLKKELLSNFSNEQANNFQIMKPEILKQLVIPMALLVSFVYVWGLSYGFNSVGKSANSVLDDVNNLQKIRLDNNEIIKGYIVAIDDNYIYMSKEYKLIIVRGNNIKITN